jgi:2-polyprenyl-3-methyl-5-hydroxy-6-metoxy-1,4-benzoquinol methylase
VLGYLTASAVVAANRTYRADALRILELNPDDEFPIVRGPSGFVFAGWLPDGGFLGRLYEDVIDHERSVTETVGYRRSLLEFAAAFLAIVERSRAAKPPLRLLDFGCGYGSMLRILGMRDVQAVGFEPSGARSGRSSRAGDQIQTDLSGAARAGPFHLFVCTEVLEHMAEPREALKFFRDNAAPGALLGVTVPNCPLDQVGRALGAARAGEPVPGVFNPWEHLNYFTASSLRRMLADEGFSVVSDLGRSRSAMDSSARFGDLSPLRALINGLRTTRRALIAAPSTELVCRCP